LRTYYIHNNHPKHYKTAPLCFEKLPLWLKVCYQTTAACWTLSGCQIVSDASIAGATIATELYLGAAPWSPSNTPGASPLIAIDYNNGRSYWDAAYSQDITGSFAIKDFNVFLTNQTENEILFQSQYTNRNQITGLVPTGLEPDTKTYPVVYLKNDGSYNVPFAFGGQDNTIMNIRAIVVADSQFEVDAIGSIFRDEKMTNIALFEETDMPFNSFGGYRDNVQYNYAEITSTKNDSQKLFLEDVNVSRFDKALENEVRKFNPNVYSTIIDFEINKIRFPRL